MVVLAEFVTVENRALSISTKTNSAIAFFSVKTFMGQKTSGDLLNQSGGKTEGNRALFPRFALATSSTECDWQI